MEGVGKPLTFLTKSHTCLDDVLPVMEEQNCCQEFRLASVMTFCVWFLAFFHVSKLAGVSFFLYNFHFLALSWTEVAHSSVHQGFLTFVFLILDFDLGIVFSSIVFNL